MSSYEWYIAPHRIDGLQFHLKLIASGGNGSPGRLDMLTPRVQIYGDTAIVNYTLLKTAFGTGGPAAAVFHHQRDARLCEVGGHLENGASAQVTDIKARKMGRGKPRPTRWDYVAVGVGLTPTL